MILTCLLVGKQITLAFIQLHSMKLKMPSGLSLVFICSYMIRLQSTLITIPTAWLQEVGPAMRPLTPPDDHMCISQEIEPEQMPQDTFLKLQDVIIPWNTDEAMVDEVASMQIVMNMGSVSTLIIIYMLLTLIFTLGGFMQTINQCPRWKIIFLDVFCEYCSWIATVSATSLLLFQDLFVEALERCLVHQGFTFENRKLFYFCYWVHHLLHPI